MKRSAVKLLAMTFTSAALAVSAAHAFGHQCSSENVSSDAIAIDESGYVPFEADYVDSTSELAGLLLDLPADSYTEMTFPPMSDYVIDEAPLLTASLNPLDTP